MQQHRHSLSLEDPSVLSSPTYGSHMYDPSQPPSSLPPAQPGVPPGPAAYYPYPPDPNSSWSPYTPHTDYPPPPSAGGWYPSGPNAQGVGGPSASTTYNPNSQSSSPYPPQGGAFPRHSFSAQSDYVPPVHPGVPPGQRDMPSMDIHSVPKERNGSHTGAVPGPIKKKRRKATGDASAGEAEEKEKRTKTGRACDACRTKKIRCDILAQSDMNDEAPICAHCKQYNLECTFFLPITETRFKKKKLADGEAHTPTAIKASRTRETTPVRPPAEVPGRIEGPTTLSFLLHTSLPASASEAYDLRYHNSWEISEDGNGLIRVTVPPSSHTSRYPDNPDDPSSSSSQSRLNRSSLNAHTISLLVNAYFDHLAHLFPIISRSEFAAKQTPPPLLLYSICGLGSTRREFPRELFAGVRGVINGLLRSNDILSDARIENVQALLVLAQVGDLHAQPTAATASASLMRTGAAIRMAQDLGLHREAHLRAQTPEDLAYVELRRRIWATCVIMDRWYGAALGGPLQVDLLDCDVLLPAGYDIILDQDPSTWPIEPSFVALSEHLKLSILVGRVLKTIYSPTGLKHATDEQLYSILEDMRAWKEGLPEGLKFAGPESSFAAGLLHLAYATLHFLLWRPFMRITYICPPHLKFALEMMHWSEMAAWATEALYWLHQNVEALDTVFIYSYTATSCALVQYHTWVRRKDAASLESLKLVRDTALQWEAAVQPDQMSIRRKTCETMTLLYEAALKTNPEDDRPPRINPTAGVLPRPALGKAVWVADASKPYGGIWVAQDDEEKEDSGLTKNSVVIGRENVDKARPDPEMESTHPASRARAISRLRGTENGTARTSGHGDGDGDGTESTSAGSRASASAHGSATEDNHHHHHHNQSQNPSPTFDNHNGGFHPDHHHHHQQQHDTEQDDIDRRLSLDTNAHFQLQPTSQHGQGPQIQTQQGYNSMPHDPMQVLREMQMQGSNVNPQLNFGAAGLGYGLDQLGAAGYGQVDPSTGYPPYNLSVLDSLPANGFNFDQWSTWFSNIDRMNPSGDPGMGMGIGGMQQQQQQQQQHEGGQNGGMGWTG